MLQAPHAEGRGMGLTSMPQPPGWGVAYGCLNTNGTAPTVARHARILQAPHPEGRGMGECSRCTSLEGWCGGTWFCLTEPRVKPSATLTPGPSPCQGEGELARATVLPTRKD